MQGRGYEAHEEDGAADGEDGGPEGEDVPAVHGGALTPLADSPCTVLLATHI